MKNNIDEELFEKYIKQDDERFYNKLSESEKNEYKKRVINESLNFSLFRARYFTNEFIETIKKCFRRK